MKKLLSFLGLLAALLALPCTVLADDSWTYYLCFENNWSISDDYKFGDTSNSTDNITWNKTLAGSVLDPSGDGTFYFKIKVIYNSNTEYWLRGTGDTGNTLTIDGSSLYISSDKQDDHSIAVSGVEQNHNYKITFVSGTDSNRNHGTVAIEDQGAIPPSEESITLRTSAHVDGSGNWIGVKYNEYDSANDTYIWYLDALSNFTSSSTFKLELNKTWYGSGSSVGNSWSTLTSSVAVGNCTPTIPVTTAGQIVRLEAKPDGSNWKARIVAGTGAHQYYWVSPQITNGKKWPSFRMDASRNRYWSGTKVIGDGLTSTKYYTFTIKDDDLVTWKTKKKIGPNTPIQWWIERDDGKVVYRPTSNLVNDTPVGYDSDHPGAGQLDRYVSYKNYWNGTGYAGEGAYMTTTTPHNTGSWSLLRKVGTNNTPILAHTFNLNADKGHVLYNYTTTGATIDPNGYDLAGNWSTGVEESVSLNANDTKPMTKYWYKTTNNVKQVSTEEIADADSIVYKVNVDRPSGGWGGLYLVVFPNSLSRNWDNHPAVLRPLITMGNNLDGRALHGALTTSNSEQSLNPEPESYYTAYTFSFNATTMTYRLEFHTPDATLSPGTEDGNHDFPNTTNEDISVVLSKEDDIHSKAVNYAIGFGTDKYFTLDETTKYTDATFNLIFDGTNTRVNYTVGSTTGSVNGKTIYVKVRGFDGTGNYGDIHTYQYTFHSKISCEPHGGLFINSAKLTITGGQPPYKYEIWHYNTKVENGETVIDFDTNPVLLSSGTFSTDSYADSENNYRISTPGFLKIKDNDGAEGCDEVTYAEVGGGFDFTYSTSENYIRNTATSPITTINANDAGAYPNGADYWLARPDDLTRLVCSSSSWTPKTDPGEEQNFQVTAGSHWSGDNTVTYLHIYNNTAYQTVTGLAAGTYTVQAIVRGGAMPVYLELNDAQVDAITLDGNNVSTISPTGRCERLENMRADDSHGGWRKLEGKATPRSDGSLKIAVRTHDGESIDLADVILLKDANSEGGFRTTASKSETDVALYDYRDRTTTKNNAYSFFDRGKNLNALVYADKHTVIAMDKTLLADDAQKAVERRHPFNVVATNGADDTEGVCEVLYLSDKGYGTDGWGNPTDFGQPSSTSDPNYAKYGKSGYSFKANLPFTANKVVFDRPFTNVSQTTIMLPFSLTEAQLQSFFGSGVQIWKYTGYTPSTKTLKFEKATDLSANTPYILINASNILDSRVSGKNVEPKTISAHGTEGDQYNSDNLSYSTTVDNEGFYTGIYKYLLVQRTSEDNSGNQYNNYGFNASTGGFSYPKASGAALKPFRCYFSVPADETVTPAASLNVIFEDVVTGISSTETIEIGDNKVYSTNGILMNKDGNLDNLPKGVYIVNGKKYVVK